MQLTCGVDWAEAHHDVALVDVDSATHSVGKMITISTPCSSMSFNRGSRCTNAAKSNAEIGFSIREPRLTLPRR
jgi:hypothetical protein